MALLFRIAGHVSSANAPDSTSNSNNFLQSYEAFQCCITDAIMKIGEGIAYLHTCHHVQELPTLHHEMQHNRDLHL
jgi:hypothetical protein